MDTFNVSDEFMFRVHGAIERLGVFMVTVMGTAKAPTWAYTIGLLEHGHPELVTVGLPSKIAGAVLQRAHEQVAAGVVLEPGRDLRRTWTSNGVGLNVAFLDIPDLQWRPPSDLVGGVHTYYGARAGYPSEPRVRQLVWPDRDGRLPWDAGFDDSQRIHQPLLDEVPWQHDRDDDHATCGPGCDFWKG